MPSLDPRTHAYVDYLAVGLLLVAPSLIGFDGGPDVVCYVVAAWHGGLSLMTGYRISLFKLIRFDAHGAIELVTAIFLFMAPWMFGFHNLDGPRNFFIGLGIGLCVVYLVTNYYETRGRDEHHAASSPTTSGS